MAQNDLSDALDKASNRDLLDLTVSNPTRCSFSYPKDLLTSLSNPKSLQYDPDPSGLFVARKAVADYYLQSFGEVVDPANLLLTASTSEAYSLLFKLLADPGDEIHIPTPGYPLLAHLAQLEALNPIPYRLKKLEGWPLDLSSLEMTSQGHSKALVVIQPNNPTGSTLAEADFQELASLCIRQKMALISDEVFRDYLEGTLPLPHGPGDFLRFRLGGISKTFGLPQLKLSWILLEGPANLLAECRERLEFIADTYLSVNTPIQNALPELISRSQGIQDQIKDRLLENRGLLTTSLKGLETVKVWNAQGGWYILLELVNIPNNDEEVALTLLEKHQVVVHPGSFYDFPSGQFLVLSLLPHPSIFKVGVSRIAEYLNSFSA